jgi:hypothetical protein
MKYSMCLGIWTNIDWQNTHYERVLKRSRSYTKNHPLDIHKNQKLEHGGEGEDKLFRNL